MVTLRSRRIRAQRRGRERPRDDAAQRVVVHLSDQELDEALELVRVPAQARRQPRRIDVLRGLERPHLHLELVPEPLDAAEHVHRVARLEPSFEHVHVVPDARGDPAARVHELEREIARAVARAQPFLARHRVNALNRAVFLELRDGRHEGEFRTAG